MKLLNTTILGTLFLLSSAHAAESTAFDKTLSAGNLSFQIHCDNNSSLNKLTIKPSGLKVSNKEIILEADGAVTDAQIGDINHDSSPEIYVYISSAGSGSYGSLVAYSADHNKSLSPIHLKKMTQKQMKDWGYMGHDKFKLGIKSLDRSFPVYKKDDSNANPSGVSKTLHYRLAPGEAAWQLKLDK